MSRTLAIASGYGSGLIIEKFLYGNGLISDDGSKYYLEDGLGNVRFMDSSTGGNSGRTDYDPFGNYRSGGNPPFQFQKQWQDGESNMTFLRARYYDQDLGRFISKDPLKGFMTNPLSQNSYIYTLDNPVNLSDPSGNGPEMLLLANPYVLAGACVVGAVYIASNPTTRNAIVGVASGIINGISHIYNNAKQTNANPSIPEGIKQAGVDVTNDPSSPPGPDWKWSGNDQGKVAWTRGSKAQGTKESLSPDLTTPGHDPHTDYVDPQGTQFRIYPDGTIEAK